MALRQRHTEGAILYEKKLKPFLKSLNEGKGTFLLCDLGQVAALPGVPAWTGMRAWLNSVQATFPELIVPAGSCVSLVHIQAGPGLLWVQLGESERKGLSQESEALEDLWDLSQAGSLLHLSFRDCNGWWALQDL